MNDAPAFGARLMGLLLAAGIALAGLYAVLSAYAPEMRAGQDGGTHALSNSAVGFSGIVQLAQATGIRTSLGKTIRSLPEGGLLVLTPDPGTDPAKVAALVEARVAQPGATPTLIVLPKWLTRPVRLHPGWVEQVADLGPLAAQPVRGLADVAVVTSPRSARCCITAPGSSRFRIMPPATLATLTRAPSVNPFGPEKAKLEPVLVASDGAVVMGWSRGKDVYILADPDLLNNLALRDPASARAALALLTALADGGPVTFDVTLNGYGRTHNLFRLAFEPPFLAVTLCLLAAAALAGLQGGFRFAPARATPRAIAFGKRALVDNAAELIRNARREPAMAGRYARLVLERAGLARGAPAGLALPELGAWLDRRASGTARFADLAERADAATTRDEALAAARALRDWQEDVTHDGR